MLNPGAIIYILCMLASIACASLLIRSYTQNHTKLLLWSGACFALLALNNLLLVLDLLVIPAVDLGILRQFIALSAMLILLFGFIWELD